MSETILKVLKPYRHQATSFAPGDILTISAIYAAYLLRDAPGCFEVVLPQAEKAVVAPPADKMLRARNARRKDK